MKVKKQLVILIIMLLTLMLLPTISRAGIESKPGATAVWSNIKISDAYATCYNLRGAASTLGTNTLDPHLALNVDWGAVAYLSLSSYGAVKSSTAPKLGTTNYTTTTGNPTGVIDFGKNYTYISSIVEGTTNDTKDPEYRENLIKALENKTSEKAMYNSKYVENLDLIAKTDITKSRGMALAETTGWYSSKADSDNLWSKYPCLVRTGVCGFTNRIVGVSYSTYTTGVASTSVTFRPAIWN